MRPSTAPADMHSNRPGTAAKSLSGRNIVSTMIRNDSEAQVLEVTTSAEMQVEIDASRRRYYEEQARVAKLQAKAEELRGKVAEQPQ